MSQQRQALLTCVGVVLTAVAIAWTGWRLRTDRVSE
jgi:hypothetical protein